MKIKIKKNIYYTILILILFYTGILCLNFENNSYLPHINRVIRTPNQYPNKNFIDYNQEIRFNGQVKKFDQTEEVNFINNAMREFVFGISGVDDILGISNPIPQPGMDERVRTYRYEINTNKGPVTIYLKWTEEDIEGERFEKASELEIAPRSTYIPLGYIISEHAPGTKLGDLLQEKDWITKKEHYRPLFEKLGRRLALLEKNDIQYSDWLCENTFVKNEGEEIEIQIIDYEDANLVAYDEYRDERITTLVRNFRTPIQQIQTIIDKIDTKRELRQKMFEIFKSAYLNEFKKS